MFFGGGNRCAAMSSVSVCILPFVQTAFSFFQDFSLHIPGLLNVVENGLLGISLSDLGGFGEAQEAFLISRRTTKGEMIVAKWLNPRIRRKVMYF